MKISKINKGKINFSKIINFYVPISIKFDENYIRNEKLYYFRLINSESTFIEISINSFNKKVTDITVVSINEISDMNELQYDCIQKIEIVNGNPTIDISIFDNSITYTQHSEFKTYKNKLFMICDFSKIVNRISMGDVELMLDKDNIIIGFGFIGFDDNEWKVIRVSSEIY